MKIFKSEKGKCFQLMKESPSSYLIFQFISLWRDSFISLPNTEKFHSQTTKLEEKFFNEIVKEKKFLIRNAHTYSYHSKWLKSSRATLEVDFFLLFFSLQIKQISRSLIKKTSRSLKLANCNEQQHYLFVYLACLVASSALSFS